MVDVGNLYDCLAGIYEGKADDSVLDKYDEIRRKMYNEFINPISSTNIVRLFGTNADDVLEKDDFLRACKRGETDVEFSRQFQTGIKVIMHDFTQYYRDRTNPRNPDLGECEKRPAPTASAVMAGALGASD